MNSRKSIMKGVKREADDCLVCCLAVVLGIPYDTIPHFVRDHGALWKPLLDDWLEVRHGYQIIAMDGWHPIHGLYLVDGVTPDGHSHVVIYKGEGLWYDSSRGAPGLRRIRRTYWLVPLLPRSHAQP